MRSPRVSCALLTLILSLCVWAQTSGKNRGTMATIPQPGTPEESMGRIFLSGKVVVDDGTTPTEPVAIQTICKGQKRTETHTDSRGNFSFQFENRVSSAQTVGVDDADISSDISRTPRSNQRDLHECELQASIPGFSSEVVQLSSRISSFGSSDIGRVVLHRLSQTEGLTLSATSALAPASATKAFEKGLERERKQRWNEAGESFKKAVQIYPKYAECWFELGRLQALRSDIAGAQQSFRQALAADPRYVNPYRGLAELAMQEKRWPEVVEITGRLLALYPEIFPDAWFRNALASYYLQNFEAAEKSARQGLKLDGAHQIPKMEYLLGLILMQRRDYTEAAAHLKQYLQLATKSGDVDDAQQRLAEIARLSGAASVPAGEEKQ